MSRLFYLPAAGWFGDVMPFVRDGVCHLFYTHLDFDDEGAPDRSKRLKWGHLSTRDFVTFQEHVTAIPAGEVDEPDLLAGAGSVVGPIDGRYHAFYVGINPRATQRGEVEQVVLRATSTDLETWEKDPGFRFEADPRWYDRNAWRDPFVTADGAGGWRMLLCAQEDIAPARRGGAVGVAVSQDLDHWEARPPLFTPGTTLAPECPEVFDLGGRTYLLYSTYSDRFAVRHRVREGERWTGPAWDALDSNDLYAATSVEFSGRRLLIGWLATRSGERDRGKRQWGGDLVVHELVGTEDGSLGVRPLGSRLDAFEVAEPAIRPKSGEWAVTADSAKGRTGPGAPFAWTALADLENNGSRASLLRATVRVDESAEESGFAIHAADDFTHAYLLRFEPSRGRFVFDRRPHLIEVPFDFDADRGYVSDPDFEIERPLRAGPEHEVTIMVEGSCISVYVDDVALTTRGYDLRGGSIAAYVSGGGMEVSGVRVGERKL